MTRCEQCRVATQNCICHLKPSTTSDAGFLLLMYDTEVLKPSNTGRLIADLFEDTFAFLWSRTEVDENLLTLLNDTQWQPIVVFPHDYVQVDQVSYINKLPANITVKHKHYGNKKRPLFILLDGSWREAKKMFRKSRYLQNIPVVSIDLALLDGSKQSGYIRKAINDNQLATAQVAASMLALYDELNNAKLLSLWFDVFNFQYQKSVCQINTGNAQALEALTTHIKEHHD